MFFDGSASASAIASASTIALAEPVRPLSIPWKTLSYL